MQKFNKIFIVNMYTKKFSCFFLCLLSFRKKTVNYNSDSPSPSATESFGELGLNNISGCNHTLPLISHQSLFLPFILSFIET